MKTVDLGKAVALVDDDDFELINSRHWHVTARGYAGRTERRGGKKFHVMMHRVIAKLSHYDERVVDHINGDKLDNRRENLRVCTHAQNLCNSKLYTTNKSGMKGVYQRRGSVRWTAYIYKDRKCYQLGTFDSAEEAHKARLSAEKQFHGQFARSSDLLREAA